MQARPVASRFALVSLLLLAGCLGATEAPLEEQSDDRASTSLDEPPTWEVGDWWTYRFTATPFNGYTVEGTIVVADANDTHYLVGMPSESFNDFMFTFHFPPMGAVSREDLSWEVHDGPLKTIHFPLTNETTWETETVGYKGQAAVEVTGATTAEIVIAPYLAPIRAHYDAEVGHYTRIGIDDYGYAELLDHGDGFQGNVTVPVDQKTIFYGRAAGVAAIDEPLWTIPSNDPNQPGTGVNPSPVDVVTFPERDHLGLVQWVGTFFLVPAASPGLFIEHAEAPDGTVYELSRSPADGEGVDMQWFRVDEPGGEWRFTHSAAGAGIATSEGILYNTLEYEL